jgi:hypothetical protein
MGRQPGHGPDQPVANLPVSKGIAKRERVPGDARLLILTVQRHGEVAGMIWGSLRRGEACGGTPAEPR